MKLILKKRLEKFFSRAQSSAGFHFLDGKKIWEKRRLFEEAYLSQMEQMTEITSEDLEKQVELIRGIYAKELNIPLSNSEEVYKKIFKF